MSHDKVLEVDGLPFTLELIECYYLLTLVCNLFLSRACARALPLVVKKNQRIWTTNEKFKHV